MINIHDMNIKKRSKLGVSMWKWVLASELKGNADNTRNLQ